MKSVTLRAHEPAGVAREREPVTCGLPFPAGALLDPHSICLRDAGGAALPCQARTLATWPDGSIKWLLLDAQVSVGPMAKESWTLEYGEGARPALPEDVVDCSENGDSDLLLSTGALEVRFGREGRAIVRRAACLDSGWQPIPEADALQLTAVDAQGVHYRAVLRDLQLEEHNPLRAVVHAEGDYVADDGSRLMGFELRAYAYAGRSSLRLYHTLVHDGPASRIEIRSLGLRIAPTLAGAPRALFGARSGWFSVGHDVGEVTGQVELLQPTVERHLLRWASGRQEAHRTNSFGWVHLHDGSHGVMLKLRHPWQNYPISCAADSSSLTLHMVPPLTPSDLRDAEPVSGMNWVELRQPGAPTPSMMLRVPQGMAKTHEIMLGFGDALADLAAADSPCLSFEMPLLLHADSTWYADSGALGAMAPYLRDHWPLEQRLRSFCVAPNGLGVLNYGDQITTEDIQDADGTRRSVVRTTENAAYDVSRSILREYLRTGHQPYFWWGEASVMHLIDVDTVHHSEEHPEWVGGPHMQWAQNHHYANTEEQTQMRPVTSHTWLGGILDYYCLTGYRRAWEVVERCAEFCRRNAPLSWQVTPETMARAHDPAQAWPYTTRVAGWPLLAMGQVYAFQPREELLPAMEGLARLFSEWLDADGRWREQVGSYNRGATPFMVASALQGLQTYVEITGDPGANEILCRAAHFVATRAVTAERLFIYKEAPISANAHPSSLMLIGPLAYVFQRTGDVSVLDAAYRFFRWMVDERLVSTYLLKDVFAALPLFERLGLLADYRGVDMVAHLAERARRGEPSQ